MLTTCETQAQPLGRTMVSGRSAKAPRARWHSYPGSAWLSGNAGALMEKGTGRNHSPTEGVCGAPPTKPYGKISVGVNYGTVGTGRLLDP